MIKLLRKVLSLLSEGKWEIIHEALGKDPSSAFTLYSSLKSKGIHCRMRKFGRADLFVTYRVEVIEDEVAHSRAILTETLRQTGP